MGPHESLWSYRDQCGSTWINVDLQQSLELQRSLWIYGDRHGSKEFFVMLQGSLWMYRDLCGSKEIFLELQELVWIYMDQCGSIWISGATEIFLDL